MPNKNLMEYTIISMPVVHDYAEFDFGIDSKVYKPVSYNPAKEISKSIGTFFHFPKNWDGYGAIPPERKTINNSKSFISTIPEIYLNAFVKSDDLSLTPYGTIILEWHNQNDKSFISFEIGKDEIGYFSKVNDIIEDCSDGISIKEADFKNEFLPLLDKIFKRKSA